MYQWFVFVHLIGVFGLLASHGISMGVMFRLRKERDPARVESLLQMSALSLAPFYVSLLALLVGGVVAAFLGDWWGYGWIWASLAVLVIVTAAMYAMARPYYQRVRFISRAMSEGSTAVTDEQWDRILRSGRPMTVAAVGVSGLVVILYFMLFKPTLGLAPSGTEASAQPSGSAVHVAAEGIAFTEHRLEAPAGDAFRVVFENRDAGIPHNVSIYDDGEPVMEGRIVNGVATVTYAVPPLDAAEYRFVCDVHPEMAGTLVAG